MVSVTTLKTKSVNSLESLLASNEEKVKNLLDEIENIKSVLAEKTQNDVVKDGLYFVDGKQDIVAEVVEGMIYQVFSVDPKLRVSRPVSIRFEKGEMVFQLKGKKHRLTFMYHDKNNKFYNSSVCILLAKASTDSKFVDTLLVKFDEFLNDETKNQELFYQALAVINNELHANYTFDKDFLNKFLDGYFVKELLDTYDVTYQTVEKIWKLILAIVVDQYQSNYYLNNIVKIPEVNL